MKISIIVLNWNNSPETIRCVRSLLGWKEYDYERIIVDNNSLPADFDALESLRDDTAILRNSQNMGFGGGNNTGIRYCVSRGADLILLLNNDVSIDEKSLHSLVQALMMHEEVWVIGPKIVEEGRTYCGGRSISRHVNTRQSVKNTLLVNDIIDVEYVPGMVMLIRSAVLSHIGFFDEEYFFSGEVADLCARVRLAGGRCATCTRSAAVHNVDSSLPFRSTLYTYYSLRNRFLYAKKFEGGLFIVFFTFWIIYGIFRAGFFLLKGRPLASLACIHATYDGIIGRFGDRNALFIG